MHLKAASTFSLKLRAQGKFGQGYCLGLLESEQGPILRSLHNWS